MNSLNLEVSKKIILVLPRLNLFSPGRDITRRVSSSQKVYTKWPNRKGLQELAAHEKVHAEQESYFEGGLQVQAPSSPKKVLAGHECPPRAFAAHNVEKYGSELASQWTHSGP